MAGARNFGKYAPDEPRDWFIVKRNKHLLSDEGYLAGRDYPVGWVEDAEGAKAYPTADAARAVMARLPRGRNYRLAWRPARRLADPPPPEFLALVDRLRRP